MGLAALKLKSEPTPLQRARRGGPGVRTPAEVRQAEGTKARPSRNGGFVNDKPHRVPPLGSPPSRWSKGRKAIWREIRSEVPWLRKPDRAAMRSLVIAEEALRAADEGEERDPDEVLKWMGQVYRWTAKLGMTPSDRTRIAHGWNEK